MPLKGGETIASLRQGRPLGHAIVPTIALSKLGRGQKPRSVMQRSRITQIALAGVVAFLIVAFVVASGPPAWAQVRPVGLSDSQEPGSVIVFPKFIRGTVFPDGFPAPKTEFEVGVVCPKNPEGGPGLCPERQP